MKSYKDLRRACLLQFNFASSPTEATVVNDDGSPTGLALEIGIELTNTQPILSFVFNCEDEKPPTLESVAQVIREGYISTSDNASLNESYGLLLDTLRRYADKDAPIFS